MTGIRYLTFDCYGTLVDWKTGIESALRDALGNLSLGGGDLLRAFVAAENEEERTYKKYRDVLAKTAVRLSKRLGVEVSRAAANRFADSVPSWPAFADTREVLDELGRKGYRRHILSNVDTDILLSTIARNHLEVDGFVTAEEVGSYKPDLRHWTRYMEKTGAARGDVLHVAQSIYHDIIPCQRMGIASAWVNRYGEPLRSDVQPEFIVESLRSLVPMLGQAATE